MAELFTTENLVALATLTILEVVLGVDNIIFLAIVTGGLPKDKQKFARRLGLSLALVGRIGLVLGLAWILRLEVDLFSAFGHDFTAKDLILVGGGVFLLYKAVTEIYKETELRHQDLPESAEQLKSSMAGVITQVILVDMIFAVDSVLTAVGLTQVVALIVIAMTIAILAMMFFAEPLSNFIEEHPSLKVLALSFLVLVGFLLVADGFGREIERGYVYFAILFSLGVEAVNFRRTANLQKQLAEQGPTGL